MKNIILIFLFALCLNSCEKYIFGVSYENNSEDVFESFWHEFDQMYGLFRIKNINWDEIYDQYRPMVDDQTTDEELYHTLVEILQKLDDGHIVLLPVGTDLPQYTGGPRGRMDTLRDFDLDILKDNYLNDIKETDFAFLYGWLEEGIGYLYIYNFADGEKSFDKELEPVLDFFGNANGLIIDVRAGDGGEDIAGKTIASHFTDQERLYMTTTIKNGPGSDDFTSPESWYIAPRGNFDTSMPIALLTNRATISARETFTLAMRTLPQVTTVGDTTSGAFSNLVLRELPNGWGYSMSIGEWRAGDGTSYEGIGLPPGVVVQNRREDLIGGKDEALEAAIELLK